MHGVDVLSFVFTKWIGFFKMKRIALMVCGLVLVVANTAEARRRNGSYNMTYTRPVAAAPTTYSSQVSYKVPVTDSAPRAGSAQGMENAAVAPASAVANNTDASQVATVSHSTSAATAKTVSYSTATAQGVANIMASRNQVGHFGGNPGYEGCGCGATAAAAYSICCYANSGMATVDVGYAQGSNGMWYCCRRYR
jgi:hypothetical protein